MLRNRNTVEFLGIWEQIHNPDFNYGEFAIIKSKAGLNSYKYKDIAFEFGMWISPEFKIYLIKEFELTSQQVNRVYASGADVSQLVCLSNMENLNALFIREGMPQSERLKKLNAIAISQMKILTEDHRIAALEEGSHPSMKLEIVNGD